MTTTFEQARDAYAQQATLRSVHTLQAYMRALDLFLGFLNDRAVEEPLPIQRHAIPTAEQAQIAVLSAADEPLLLYFAHWLQSAPPNRVAGDRRPYSHATVQLRLAGVQRWFEFMEAKGWLPPDFSLAKTVANLHQLDATPAKGEKPALVKVDMAALMDYYSTQKPPKRVSRNAEQLGRWELTRLRNQALIQMLAETGGQVSAILDLNVGDVSPGQRPLQIVVKGKSQHVYTIFLDSALHALYEYLHKRPDTPAKSPLFVSHDAHFNGQRMSRVIAWRVIQRAARGVGLPRISPHDLRHWRARQLIQQGASIQELKERLGHRSTHTIRVYYGHLLDES